VHGDRVVPQARSHFVTQTIDPATAQQAASDAATTRVQTWLGDFEAALLERDVERAAAMFAAESFWRDLVAFTWNITTVEAGRASRSCCGPPWTAPIRAASA